MVDYVMCKKIKMNNNIHVTNGKCLISEKWIKTCGTLLEVYSDEGKCFYIMYGKVKR